MEKTRDLIDYAKANSATGNFTTIGGVSAKGKEPFYEKMGFEIISNGMIKMIEIEQRRGRHELTAPDK